MHHLCLEVSYHLKMVSIRDVNGIFLEGGEKLLFLINA